MGTPIDRRPSGNESRCGSGRLALSGDGLLQRRRPDSRGVVLRPRGSGVKLAIEPGQRAAAERALAKAYQGDLAGARRECWTMEPHESRVGSPLAALGTYQAATLAPRFPACPTASSGGLGGVLGGLGGNYRDTNTAPIPRKDQDTISYISDMQKTHSNLARFLPEPVRSPYPSINILIYNEK